MFTACYPRATRPARALPGVEPTDGPRSTRALADLAWLSSRPTRNTLHPTSLAVTRPHRHCARSAAAASKHCGHRVRLPWRASPARVAPWMTGRPPMEHRALVRCCEPPSRERIQRHRHGGFRVNTNESSSNEGTARCLRTSAERCEVGRSATARGRLGCAVARTKAFACPWCGVWCRGTSSRPASNHLLSKKSDHSVIYEPIGVMFRRGYLPVTPMDGLFWILGRLATVYHEFSSPLRSSSQLELAAKPAALLHLVPTQWGSRARW